MGKLFSGLWRQPDFLKLWGGETVSQFGTQVTVLALPLTAVLVLHATAGQMGILNAVEFAPFLLLSLFAGVWVDRMRRRPILIIGDIGRALLLGSVPVAALLGLLSIEYLYVVAVGVGVLTVFFDIAYQSYLPSLVERTQIVEGNGKLEVSRSVAQIAGPSIAGVLIQLVTAPIAIAVDATSFLVSAAAVWTIRKPEPKEERQPGERRNMWHEIGEGMGVVFGSRYLRSIAGCTGTSNLFGNVLQAVSTLYLVRVLGLNAGTIGLIFGVGSAGALLGAIFAGTAARRFGLGRTIIVSIAIASVGWLAYPLAGGPQWAVVGLLLVGQFIGSVGSPIYNINQVSLRQAITPHRLQGRMNASMRFLVWGTMPIGSLIGGVLGDNIGLYPTLIIGVIGICSAFLWVLFSPVRNLRDQPAPVEDAPVSVAA